MCVAPVGEGAWIMCNTMKTGIDMVHGFQQRRDRCWQVVTWAPSMSNADDAWHTDTFSCWLCQRARHSLGSAQNCPGQLGYREVCTHWVPKNPMDDDKADCMGLSCILWTCYTDQREQFWSWNMVNYTIWNQKNPAKKMEGFSSLKMTAENCLGTKNMCLFWISLTMVTLCAECYCSIFSLQQPFFAKGLSYFTWKCQASCTQLDLQLIMAVHLIGYGSVRSVFYLSLNLEKHLAGKWLQ